MIRNVTKRRLAGRRCGLGGGSAWTGWGLLLFIFGLAIYLIGIAESTNAAGHVTGTPVPDPQGDTARGGPVAV